MKFSFIWQIVDAKWGLFQKRINDMKRPKRTKNDQKSFFWILPVSSEAQNKFGKLELQTVVIIHFTDTSL